MSSVNQLITVAQIGCGYWGPNLLRNFTTAKNCKVKYLVDSSEERRAYVENQFRGVKAVADFDHALDDSEVDAIILATPALSHYSLAKSALLAGKHVFVEKPLATKVAEVDELGSIAQQRNLILMAGHTFLFNNAVRYVRKLIDNDDLGELRYIYSQRLNLGRIRSDIDALWNFAPHDISIIQYWLNDIQPTKVSRSGMAYFQPGIDDVVFLNVEYPNKVMANIHVSWLDPHKTRKMVVVGSKKMVVYDDVAEDKIAIYDKGIDQKAVLGERMDYDQAPLPQFSYRTGDILFPQVNFTEPLRAEVDHFLNCIKTGEERITGYKHARQVVHILEQAGGQNGKSPS
jgi:predicted dehydrogenase